MKNVRFAAMMLTVIVGAVFMVSGCVNKQAAQSVQAAQAFGQVCAAYVAVMKTATVANDTGHLNAVQRAAISKADEKAYPICAGQPPADMTTAIKDVSAAITEIAINSIVEAETKK